MLEGDTRKTDEPGEVKLGRGSPGHLCGTFQKKQLESGQSGTGEKWSRERGGRREKPELTCPSSL